MTGMKEKLGPEKYEIWYARHRIVENQRVWRLEMEANPMNTIPEFERVMPETYSLEDAFYHYRSCKCGSCVGPLGVMAKALHTHYFPSEKWLRGASNPPTVLPRLIREILLAVEEEVLSPPDPQS